MTKPLAHASDYLKLGPAAQAAPGADMIQYAVLYPYRYSCCGSIRSGAVRQCGGHVERSGWGTYQPTVASSIPPGGDPILRLLRGGSSGGGAAQLLSLLNGSLSSLEIGQIQGLLTCLQE